MPNAKTKKLGKLIIKFSGLTLPEIERLPFQ